MTFNPALPSPTAAVLPVYTEEAALLEAIRHHQVVVIQGPTGCGKTTQIPQMLLRAGLTDKLIGVTQPRRIAAVSVAWRIAQEQNVECGREVGFAIRFDDCTSPVTRIKIMTDGLLLQEAHHDPDFERYGVIVVDEAHERSLNIDFLLGLLHGIVTRRADLRVIVSSATLDPARFVKFFADVAGSVPVVAIDARPFPVAVQYRPMDGGMPQDYADAITREVVQIHRSGQPGHILAFLSGEDAIKRTATAVARQNLGRDVVILTLYGALTREEQERVFEAMPGKRKVILATNIAETSITIDDTRYVIDSGIAKVPRVSSRTGIMLLREEGISRASADQRLGRAGRTAPGTCIRLYTHDSYRNRPEFTDEEILRLDLAEVVLKLIDLGVKEVETFPFPTLPQRSRISAAVENLLAMQAIDIQRNLTPIGKRMVPFPLSPNLARMVVEAAEKFPDVVDEVLIVAAFLSTRQPQVYPQGQEDAARKAHAAFGHSLGDVVTAVKLFRTWQRAGDAEDSRAQWAKQHYLDPNALKFIASAHDQLCDIAQRQGIEIARNGDPENLVRCVAAGFAQNILTSKGRFFEGPGDDKIFIHPSSVLYAASPRFVVAAELMISQRAYARQVSILKPAWVAELRRDLADRWQLNREHLMRKDSPPPAQSPREIRLGPVTLEIDARKGKPRLDIPYEAIGPLLKLAAEEIPPETLRWQTRLIVGSHIFAAGTPLGTLLALLPLLPLPKPDANLRCTVPEGALLEVDLNAHTLLLQLPNLLKPMLQGNGKKPGWVMLVANGGGGYWFEVGMDYREALETTLISLDDLLEVVPEADELHKLALALLEKWQPQLEAVRTALDRARRSRRG